MRLETFKYNLYIGGKSGVSFTTSKKFSKNVSGEGIQWEWRKEGGREEGLGGKKKLLEEVKSFVGWGEILENLSAGYHQEDYWKC